MNTKKIVASLSACTMTFFLASVINNSTYTSASDYTYYYIVGDANQDDKLNVRDAACIASALAKGKADTLTYTADYNQDKLINVRDAAGIAKYCANSYNSDAPATIVVVEHQTATEVLKSSEVYVATESVSSVSSEALQNTSESSTDAGGSKNNADNNYADLVEESGLQIITGPKTVMQAFWMDASQYKDYVFNGEYLTAQFKIKEGAANGIYPVTIEWADFSNWDAQTIKFATIDGAVVVGGEAKENSFNDNSDPQLMVTNVSGNVGDTVTVAIHIKNNPGVVANILRFGYNSDALEYVGGGEGADFNGHFS